VLTLQYSLHDNLHHPRHVCSTCTTTIDAFTTLRDLALKNELVLFENKNFLNPTADILVKEKDSHEDYDDYCNDIDMNDSLETNFVVEDKNILKTEIENNDELKEKSEDAILISFLKPKNEEKKKVGRPKGELKPKIDRHIYRYTCPVCNNTFSRIKEHMKRNHNLSDVNLEDLQKEKAVDSEKIKSIKKIRKIIEDVIKDMKADPLDPDLRLDCPMCDNKSSKKLRKHALFRHLRLVHKEADLPCKYEGCNAVFKREGCRKTHHKRVHEGVKELCTYCGEYYKNLSDHIKVHVIGPFKCPHCDKEYMYENSLNSHIKLDHLKGKEICHICAKEYKDLKYHMKYAHQGGNLIKEIPCEVPECDRKFRTMQEAKKHLNSIHLNKREQCPECGISVKNLSTHLSQVHRNVGKHLCPQCGRGFSKKCDVKEHIERVHNQRRYICPHCSRSVCKIREHLRVAHKMFDVGSIDHIQIVRG